MGNVPCSARRAMSSPSSPPPGTTSWRRASGAEADRPRNRASESGRPAVIDVAVAASVVHPITLQMLGNLQAENEIVVPYYDNIPKR